MEVSLQIKRNNGTVRREKIEIPIPVRITTKLSGGNKNIDLLRPYAIQFLDSGERIKWYTKRILINDIELHNISKEKKATNKKTKTEYKINSGSIFGDSPIFIPFKIIWFIIQNLWKIIRWINK